MKTIRIANGAGFWGDSLDAPRRLIETAGPDGIDYLTLEYLAELTMSILAHLKSRDPQAGYVTDFPTVLAGLLPSLSANRLKIITNAGGMNPAACALHIAKLLNEAGLGETNVAAVAGDDLLPRLDNLLADGETFPHFDTGEPLGDRLARVVCANAYLGATGIVDALRGEARIVITGRVADASLTLGPALHEFPWPMDDWDRLAAATVAGHLIECGAQVTGGMFSDWTPDMSLHDVGYPIAELTDDGGCVITKPPHTGGAVTTGTVAEQLIYEIGDPAHYLTPDVDADFTHVTLHADGTDRVRVDGAKGRPAPPRYKVSLAYRNGYMHSNTLIITGPQAREKAQACAAIIRQRLQHAGCLPARLHAEILGGGDVVPGILTATDPQEVVLRMAAYDDSRETLERFGREFAPLVTSGPPGVTGYTGPRPKPYPVLAYWPTTIDRDDVTAAVDVRPAKEWTA